MYVYINGVRVNQEFKNEEEFKKSPLFYTLTFNIEEMRNKDPHDYIKYINYNMSNKRKDTVVKVKAAKTITSPVNDKHNLSLCREGDVLELYTATSVGNDIIFLATNKSANSKLGFYVKNDEVNFNHE